MSTVVVVAPKNAIRLTSVLRLASLSQERYVGLCKAQVVSLMYQQ